MQFRFVLPTMPVESKRWVEPQAEMCSVSCWVRIVDSTGGDGGSRTRSPTLHHASTPLAAAACSGFQLVVWTNISTVFITTCVIIRWTTLPLIMLQCIQDVIHINAWLSMQSPIQNYNLWVFACKTKQNVGSKNTRCCDGHCTITCFLFWWIYVIRKPAIPDICIQYFSKHRVAITLQPQWL